MNKKLYSTQQLTSFRNTLASIVPDLSDDNPGKSILQSEIDEIESILKQRKEPHAQKTTARPNLSP